MKLRKLLGISFMALSVLAFTACGKKDDNTLSVQIWDSYQEPGINEILKDFTAKTGIKTKLTVVSWQEYWTALEAGAQGGALPDVFWMHSNESYRYMSNNMLLDLTDKIKESSEIKMENYPESIWGLYTLQDKNYAIPKDIDTIALWYNKALFDEANVPYPTSDWTWDDFGEAAKKLTNAEKGQYGMAIRNDNNQAGYYNMIYGNGGYIISDDKKKSGWDDPKTVEAMEQLESWIKDGSMTPLESMSVNGEEVLFQTGKAAMVLQGSWMISLYKGNDYVLQNCDLVELPKNKNTGKRVSLYNGLGWAASANTKHKEEAWKLLEYLGSKEAQTKQAKLGVTMSAYNGTSDDWKKSAPFNLQAYINMQDDMVIRPYSNTTITWEENASESLKDVYLGNRAMSDVCKDIAAYMNEQLANE